MRLLKKWVLVGVMVGVMGVGVLPVAAQEVCDIDMSDVVDRLTRAMVANTQGDRRRMELFLRDARFAIDAIELECGFSTSSADTGDSSDSGDSGDSGSSDEVFVIQPGDAELNAVFTASDDAFTIEYPEEWTAESSNVPPDGVGASFSSPDQDGFPVVSMIVGSAPSMATWSGFASTSDERLDDLNNLDDLREMMAIPRPGSPFTDLELGEATIGSITGIRLQFAADFNGMDLEGVFYVFEVVEGETYVAFALSTTPERVEELLPVMHSMMYALDLP